MPKSADYLMSVTTSMEPKIQEAVCVFCEQALYKAPTDIGWIRAAKHGKGLCYDCIRSAHRLVEAVDVNEAPVLNVDGVTHAMEIHTKLITGDIKPPTWLERGRSRMLVTHPRQFALGILFSSSIKYQ